MSEKPPKKKLRQTSVMDMFKKIEKKSEVIDATDMESKPKEVRTIDNTGQGSKSKQVIDNSFIKSKSKEAFDQSTMESKQKEEITWRGTPLSSLEVLGNSGKHVPVVAPSPNHTVMVQLPLPESGVPDPYPSSYSDAWDQHHVRMPCSPKSLYPNATGTNALSPRWSLICKVLKREMRSINDLQRNILEYNTRYAAKWNFKGLQQLVEQEFEEEERDYFFEHTLPSIADLALDLPNVVTQPLPLLTRHSTHSITLSQMQIASLLANAFFCTYPRRNAKGGDTEYASYPDINFNRMFSHKEKRSLEKLKCILNYFRRVNKKKPEGLVTFTRQYVGEEELPSWETSSHHLPELHIDTNGLIEEKEGLLQVDFANKFIGGGVLGLGCVQEEIRFVLSPELILSRLFTQVLDKTEALIITGSEQYNKGSGYASTFSWTGSHKDITKRDVWKRRLCQVVAIDALRFTRPKHQYKPHLILREINKVYAGYLPLKGSKGPPISVATGNWGCGAFNGNSKLKALIQLAACGYTGRNVAYFTFGDEKLRNDLSTMHIFLKENNITVGELVQTLVHYGQRDWVDGSDLYQYIYHSLGAYDSDTDDEQVGNETGPAIKNKDISIKPISQSGSSVTSKLKMFECTRKYSSTNNSSNDNNLPGTSTSTHSSSITKEENLTEERIVEVLKECDRLVEGQKKKTNDGLSKDIYEEFDDVTIENEISVAKSQVSRDSTKSEKIIEQCVDSNKSDKQRDGLFAALDDIDKQSSFLK